MAKKIRITETKLVDVILELVENNVSKGTLIDESYDSAEENKKIKESIDFTTSVEDGKKVITINECALVDLIVNIANKRIKNILE